MNVKGVGTDIIEVARIAELAGGRGTQFVSKWFTASELAYCQAKRFPERHLAARLAAKEAVWKALGLPSNGPIPWRDIEVQRSALGQPSIALSGDVASAATRAGVVRILISLSHSAQYATATAVSLGQDPEADPALR